MSAGFTGAVEYKILKLCSVVEFKYCATFTKYIFAECTTSKW
jgi:hypothetical protein